MDTLPTLLQALEAFFDQLLSVYSAAFSDWWRDVKKSMQSVIKELRFPPNPIGALIAFQRHLFFIVARFEKLLQDLLTAPRTAVLQTALKLALDYTPPEWNSQVVKRNVAFKDCATAIVTGILDGGSLSLPIPARLASWITTIKGTLTLVKSPPGAVALLFKLTVGTVLSIIIRLLDLLLQFVTAVAAVMAVWALWLFVSGMAQNPSKYLRPLSQTAPRIKWYSHRGQTELLLNKPHRIIRRRDPGGVKP